MKEVRADARTLLRGTFDEVVQNMQAHFAQEDHAMLVGRKLSVDWSLTPALLISDIVRGAPPSHWMANLDDAYGRSAPLPIGAEEIPQEVADGCAFIRRDGMAIRFSYLAERLFAAGAEVPPAIAWECDIRPAETTLRTAWYEPSLAQRGVDFPMPPDRTLLSWTDALMRLRVLEESADWSMAWPTEAPLFDHVGDAYDLFDSLRAWYWARREGPNATESTATLLAGTMEKAAPRIIRWNRISDNEWILAITLRPCAALRRAGFTVKADGVDQSTLPIGRPTAIVPIVAADTIVTLSFTAARDSDGEIPNGTFLPRRLALRVNHQEVAHATLHSFARARADTPPQMGLQMFDSSCRDAILRIRHAQGSTLPPNPFDSAQLTLDSDKSLLRARLAANAWIFAMNGDIATLMTTITRAQDLRRLDGLSHHDLTALETFAESLTLGLAPDSIMHALRVRHALAAADLATDALVPACLAATGTGRFWAALDIAQAGVARATLGSSDEIVWRRACERLTVWCVDPLSHTVFGADPGVLLLSQRIAAEMGIDSNSPITAESPTATIDGRAAGGALRELQRILDPMTIPERNHS